jgi:multidrug resistance efflux pump
MSLDFVRTTAALAREGRRTRLALLAVGLALLGLWAAWLSAAELAIHMKSGRARIEVASLVHPVHVEVEGRVRASHLDLDRLVARGDVLVELDREGPELELREAEARIAANQSVLGRMESLAATQRSLVEQLTAAGRVAVDETSARARRAAVAARFSTRNAKRWTELRKRGLAAEMDVLENQANAEGQRSLARAERLASRRVAADQVSIVKERQAQIEELQVEMAKRQVDIAADEVLIRRLWVDIEKRTVRAPIDGRLGWVETISPGVTVAPGQRVATIVPSGKLRIVASFPAREAAGRLRPGQPASLILEAYPWAQYGEVTGRVTHVGTEPHDGQLRVEVAIDDAQSGAIPRAHGLQGTLTVTVERATPLVLLLRSVGRLIAGDAEPDGRGP